MDFAKNLVLSCWITETARSAVLESRKRREAASKSAARARILASYCADQGVRITPAYVREHATWLASVVGTEEDTGALGLVFLQRLGSYIDAHVEELLGKPAGTPLRELGELELEQVNEALMSGGLYPPPPPEWPDAPVAKAPGRTRARFGIVGDPHVGHDPSRPMVSASLRDLAADEASFAVAIGDITKDGDPELFKKAKEIFDGSPIPVALTLGNHDMWRAEDGESAGLKYFTETFQRSPSSVHRADGVTVIVINSADPTRSPFSPFEIMTGEFTDAPGHSVPGGTFSSETVEWMRSLEPEGATFIALHHPPYPYLGLPPLVFGLNEASTEELRQLVRRTRARAVFCGHTHRSALTEFEGVPVVEIASSNDWPWAYGLVEVTEGGWSFNLRPIREEWPPDSGSHAAYLFRRYAEGPPEARAFAVVDAEREGN
ncbi:MAG: metallophosphoesterase [Actinomycetota bacterium]|nr:metallophosphoesterase [Actinomycetota bacterium]